MKLKWDDLLKKSTEVVETLKNSKENIFAALDQNEVLRWLDEVKFASTQTYDKAMDAEYNATSIGGGHHRLFDNGHSLLDAWEKVKAASPDDTFTQEVLGYLKALWNDGSTVKGLPFQTLEKANYDEWVEAITDALPGISKEWLYDLTSFDAAELAGVAAGLIAAFFQLKNEDKTQFDQLLGSMGVSSIIGANPLMGIVVIALAGYAYFHKKHEFDKKAVGKSAAATAFASALFLLLGFPFLVELLIVLIAGAYFKKKVLNNDDLLELIAKHGMERAGIAKSVFLRFIDGVREKMDRVRSA